MLYTVCNVALLVLAQVAQDFVDAVHRAQKGSRDLRPDAWLAHFVQCNKHGLVLSDETRV